MDPPQCVQNAMMTKDKKPFTYTPGGIDLSEVRSPRMARRIERNANLAGAGDVPKYQPPPPQNSGPLPPSVQAVMRPQPQVQVFPSGPAPPPSMARGGAPPPPPPMCAPPPPPPPSGPLPTQKVMTSDNQVLERPDMTKIIPDNPMALLRKTSGPQPRKSLVDEMFAQAGKPAPVSTTPPAGLQYEQPQQQRYQPPVDRGAPISPVPQQYQPAQPQAQYQPPRQQYQQPVPQQYQSPPQPYQPPPPQQQYQPPTPPQQRSPEAAREQPRYQPPVIERQPTIPRQNNVQPEVKTSTAHLGSLYIPPASQQQQQPQRRVVSPPTPPERNQDSPSIQTPPLKEAPRPWQAKKVQQDEVPSWAKRDNQVPTNGRQEPQNAYQSPSPPTQQQQPQQRWPQSRSVQQPHSEPQQYNQQIPGGAPVRIIIRTNTGPTPYPSESEERKPEAVYITQPIVLQHPGPRQPPQQQRQSQNVPQPRVDSQAARVIPVQVDSNQGGRTPTTPGNDRTLNRQQSWGNNPTQSNSFKIIQKLTQTDDDDEDDEVTPVTEHAPRYPQNFQHPPAEQLRRMKLNEGDQNLMNKFKQVPSGPQPQRNKGPQVRTIPVQIEGNDSPQPYVHPSEQVVPEPKKYTGSSIPSRSFKILQAMTAPDNCANVDEQYEAYPYEQWGYDPNYPPYPHPPYWHDYYNYYYPEPGLSSEESYEASAKTTPRETPTPRQTPVPFWGYAPPYPYPVPRRPNAESESDAESSTNPRSTPLHFWGEEGYAQYPPYYDPYYYSYYYGYPPMYPPYPYYGNTTDSDDYAGYSSTDEMSYYNKRFAERSGRRSSLGRATPRLSVTPTLNVKEKVIARQPEVVKQEPEIVSETESDSDTETCEEEENTRDLTNSPLKSIKSVSNIHMYAEEESSHSSDDEVCIQEYIEDNNEDVDDESSLYLVDDDAYPHQLSVIYEESERTDSRMRTASALSDSTTIAERSDYEEDQSPAIVTKPFKFCVSVTEENNEEVKMVVTVNDREIKTFEENDKVSVDSPVTPENITDPIQISTIIKNNHDEKCITQPVVEEEEEEGKESDGSEDWWGILGKDDDLPQPKSTILKKNSIDENEKRLSVVIEEDAKPIEKEASDNSLEKSEVAEMSKSNYAKATKSVYDKIEDQFEEEENSGTLMEMDSFVSKLEQLQKESGLWNIVLPPKSKGSVISKSTTIKEKTSNTKNIKPEPEKCGNESLKVHQPNRNYASYADAKSDESDVDFWSTIKSEEDELQIRRQQYAGSTSNEDSSASYNNYNYSESCLEENGDQINKEEETVEILPESEINTKNKEIYVAQVETEESSDEPESSKQGEEAYVTNEIETEESSDEMDSSSGEEEDESEEQPKNEIANNEDQQMKAMSIQERIQALKETIKLKQSKLQEQEAKLSVKDKISVIETASQNRSKTTSTKSSLKSFEEYSEEEEGDSGVTSDMSRHISDTEEFPEFKKLTRYQRAATHSRLFKLLQDECDNEEDEEDEEVKVSTDNSDKFSKLSVRKIVGSKEEPPRRDHLSLPLKNTIETESLSSSGINSPGSPVNEKLVNELVQSLLKRKKGQAFRNMPKEKLYAAAARVLQEDMDGLDTPDDCSSFLSPLRGSTGYSTAAQTPQEFNGTYDEYKQYYETWSEAEKLYDQNYDILPSKAFKLLQEHSNLNKTGSIAGLLAKCPRVLSSKNIHKKLLKLLESPDCPSPTPENPLESNEVTSPS